MLKRFDLGSLVAKGPAVLPSMLLCDFTNLRDEVRELELAGVRALHLDVMDGVFVPNFSYGLTIVRAFQQCASLPLDIHLMMANPSDYVAQFREAGGDMISFHAEAVEDPRPVLDQIRDSGAAAGIAINPQTSAEQIESSLAHCDYVLVMTVQAGFGGQEFQSRPLEKIRELRAIRPELRIEVDGGINTQTIEQCVSAGADLLVAGSAIFGQSNYSTAIKQLQTSIESANREMTNER